MIPLEGLAEHYGYIGLFISSLIASTIIPFSAESLLLLAQSLGMKAIESIGIVTLASTFGGLTTYFLGRSGVFLFKKKINGGKIERYKGVVTRGGAPIIFLAAFTPIPYEFFSFSAGFLKMNIYAFLVSTLAGRILRFALVGFYGQRAIKIFRAGEWKTLALLAAVGLAAIIVSTYISWKMIKSKSEEKTDNGKANKYVLPSWAQSICSKLSTGSESEEK